MTCPGRWWVRRWDLPGTSPRPDGDWPQGSWVWGEMRRGGSPGPGPPGRKVSNYCYGVGLRSVLWLKYNSVLVSDGGKVLSEAGRPANALSTYNSPLLLKSNKIFMSERVRTGDPRAVSRHRRRGPCCYGYYFGCFILLLLQLVLCCSSYYVCSSW